MGRPSTVTLEILRRGLAYRQALTPVTDYQALCGNHEAVTLHLPFEHHDVLHRVNALRYASGDARTRAYELRTMAQDLRDVFADIPGLISELTGDGTGFTNLRLVLSAPELALLPFELVECPPGFPAAGQPMVLQSVAPLTITREVRRVSGDGFEWPIEPRILFAAAAPPEAGSVPLRPHLVELRKAIDPWLRATSRTAIAEAVGRMLTVLPDASLDEIQEACASGGYTHVHILAHGAPLEGTDRGGYGLALWDHDKRKAHVVSGGQLANALRAHVAASSAPSLAAPAVVTVSSCDSGNVGDVIAPGASLAHELHEAGVPFVVASQFPLSKAGSVRMVRVLYQRLLWGDDPRVVLHDLRRQLHQMDESIHDWASLVAYAALPADIDRQLRGVRSQRTDRAARAAMGKLVGASPLRAEEAGTGAGNGAELVRHTLEDMERAFDRMPDLAAEGLAVEDGFARLSEELGLRGSAEKSRAQAYFHHAEAALAEHGADATEAELDEHARRAKAEHDEALDRAIESYRRAFELDMSSHWAATQFLCLSVVRNRDTLTEHWEIARAAARLELRGDDPQAEVWAHCSLFELALLALARPGESGMSGDDARAAFSEHWVAFQDRVEPDSFEHTSTLRQLGRYAYWWTDLEGVTDLAQALLERIARTGTWDGREPLELDPS